MVESMFRDVKARMVLLLADDTGMSTVEYSNV